MKQCFNAVLEIEADGDGYVLTEAFIENALQLHWEKLVEVVLPRSFERGEFIVKLKIEPKGEL